MARKTLGFGVTNSLERAEKLVRSGVRFPPEAPVGDLVTGLQTARSEAARIDPAIAEPIGLLRASLVEPFWSARK